MTCSYPDLGTWGGKKPSEAEADAVEQAENLAWSTFIDLAGGQLTVCPITVRPTFDQRWTFPTWLTNPVGTWPGSSYEPYRLPEDAALFYDQEIFYGAANSAAHAVVALERPVGQVVQVMIDGAVVDPSLYRVDEGRLMRTDGSPWPLRNDLLAPSGSVGVFEITYYRGYRPSKSVITAVGVLAVEFYKMLTGNKTTRLPERVTNVTRQGVTFQIPATLFDDGRTGIREVDIVLRRINPGAMRQQTLIMSPDTIRHNPRVIGY